MRAKPRVGPNDALCASVVEWATGSFVRNDFTVVFERDGAWYVAYCPEIPGANGQGLTREEARRSLLDAIALILADRGAMASGAFPPMRNARR